jgi:hypothetical protein
VSGKGLFLSVVAGAVSGAVTAGVIVAIAHSELADRVDAMATRVDDASRTADLAYDRVKGVQAGVTDVQEAIARVESATSAKFYCLDASGPSEVSLCYREALQCAWTMAIAARNGGDVPMCREAESAFCATTGKNDEYQFCFFSEGQCRSTAKNGSCVQTKP